MDSKSQLNVYCQKNNLEFPIYENPLRQDGTFLSICTFNNDKYTSDLAFTKKKDADQNIAKIILEKINGIPVNLELDPESTLIIDLDNQGNIQSYYNKISDFHIIAIGGPNSILPTEIKDSHIIFKTNSTSKDAADITLAFTIGKYLSNLKKNVYIFSKDYAFKTLESILNDHGIKTIYNTDIRGLL